jgi:hypothetical protein
MTIVEADRVTGGVDTHLDVHVAAALDPIGGVLGVESFPTNPTRYRELLAWMSSFGPVARVGVEGTGAYGAGLARYLHRHGVEVIEVDRANRQARRQAGKSDPADAVEAARAAQSRRARGLAKTRDGNVEAIRVLLVARRSSRAMRVKTLCQLRHLSFTGPDELRERLQGLSAIMLPREAAAMRPRAGGDVVAYTTKLAIRTLARRVGALDEETEQSTSCWPCSSRRRRRPCWRSTVSVSMARRHCSSLLATTQSGFDRRRRGRTCAVCHRSRRPRGRWCAIGSTVAVTARPTVPCGAS